MAENYREQQQEETEGVVDAGGFENDPGTGMVAEDQETAGAADAQPEAPMETPYQSDEEAIEEVEAAENAQVDLHEDTGSGIDIAVIVIILLVIIGCLSFAYANAPTEEEQQIIAQQQALKQALEEATGSNDNSEPPFEVAELPEGVAAIVNGEEISEGTIDEYVASFRGIYELNDDDDWAEWLVAYDYTPEKLRNAGISTYVTDALIDQAIVENGIEVSQADVDAIYNETRSHFESEEEWQAGLEQALMTEESFREQCEDDAKKQAFMKFLGESAITPEEVDAETLRGIKDYYPEYADAESLDGIPADIVDPVREMVEYYAQQDAYAEFMEKARTEGDIKMSAMPSNVPYDANLLIGYFRMMGNQLSQSQAAQQ